MLLQSLGSQCLRRSIVRCEASAEVTKGTRRRRVRRADQETLKKKETRDLHKQVENLVHEEETRWKGPSEEELIGKRPHPLLGGMLQVTFQRVFEMNSIANDIMKKIFDEKFRFSRARVDYFEFRLLEWNEMSNAWMMEFFLEFGYEMKNEFVLREKPHPIYCKVLHPPLHQNLPKIILSSLKIDECLSEEAQDLIKKRMESWLSFASKFGSTALGCCATPWEFPNQKEMELLSKESEFVSWCLIHGYTPSCVAMSVNEMQKAFHKFGTNPNQVTLPDILEVLRNESPLNPAYRDPIWDNDDGSSRVVATVAEVLNGTLSDGAKVSVPGSHVAFIERSVLDKFQDLPNQDGFVEYNEEHYNQGINEKLVSYMHGSIESSLMIEAKAREVHEAIIAKAKEDGKVLTLDGSNEDDDKIYLEYLQEVIDGTLEEGEKIIS